MTERGADLRPYSFPWSLNHKENLESVSIVRTKYTVHCLLLTDTVSKASYSQELLTPEIKQRLPCSLQWLFETVEPIFYFLGFAVLLGYQRAQHNILSSGTLGQKPTLKFT